MHPTHRPEAQLTGDGHVDYVVERFPLGPGEYRLTFAVHDTHAMMVFDKSASPVTLRVQAGEEPIAGLTDLSGRWDPPSGPTMEPA
jgi:hypothetical protein